MKSGERLGERRPKKCEVSARKGYLKYGKVAEALRGGVAGRAGVVQRPVLAHRRIPTVRQQPAATHDSRSDYNPETQKS